MSADDKKKLEQAAEASVIVATSMPDLESVRLPQNFAANLGVKRRLVQVPVTKPRRGWFVRARPGAEWRLPVAMIELKDVNESYIVAPSLAADLPLDVKRFELVTAITRDAQVFLWPLRMPNMSRQDPWADSAMTACKLAETSWLRVDAGAGAYLVSVATAAIPEPEWPEENLDQLYRLAFRDRVIESIHHPEIRRLRGAA